LPFTKMSRCWWMWKASCSWDSAFSPSDGRRWESVAELFGHGGRPLWSPGSVDQTIGFFSASGGGFELLLDELRVRAIPRATPTMTSAVTTAAVGQKYFERPRAVEAAGGLRAEPERLCGA
jgi:hypothetical protein